MQAVPVEQHGLAMGHSLFTFIDSFSSESKARNGNTLGCCVYQDKLRTAAPEAADVIGAQLFSNAVRGAGVLSLAIGAQAGGMLAFGTERDRSNARARSEKNCACPEPVLAENPSFGIGQISLTERNARLPSFCRRGGGADVAWHGEKRLLSRACLGKSLLFARGHENSTKTSVFAGDACLLSHGCRHPGAVYAAAAGARNAAEFCNTILISMRTPIICQDRLGTG